MFGVFAGLRAKTSPPNLFGVCERCCRAPAKVGRPRLSGSSGIQERISTRCSLHVWCFHSSLLHGQPSYVGACDSDCRDARLHYPRWEPGGVTALQSSVVLSDTRWPVSEGPAIKRGSVPGYITEHVSRCTSVRTSSGTHGAARLKHVGFHMPSCPPTVWICQRGATIIYNNLAELQHHLETCASSSCRVRPLVLPIYTSHRDNPRLRTHPPIPPKHRDPHPTLSVFHHHTAFLQHIHNQHNDPHIQVQRCHELRRLLRRHRARAQEARGSVRPSGRKPRDAPNTC
jgi:hypothetical protein